MKQKEHKKIISTVSVDFHEKQGWGGGLEQQTLWSQARPSNHPEMKKKKQKERYVPYELLR
jgi:hypothetical protein